MTKAEADKLNARTQQLEAIQREHPSMSLAEAKAELAYRDRPFNAGDIIIRDLLDAIDYIYRESLKDDCSRHYIQGVCEGATSCAKASLVRNSDGYLVAKG